jgi:two-component system, chemotaxis family, chemotaxis protein CheY
MAKILIVDDAAFLRVRIAQVLTNNGYEIVEAANGQIAVDTYQAEHPDCVLMDISMPEMNGLEALKAIRALDPQAKIIMVTALGQQAMVREAIVGGARDIIVKPFEPDRVLDAIRKALA